MAIPVFPTANNNIVIINKSVGILSGICLRLETDANLLVVTKLAGIPINAIIGEKAISKLSAKWIRKALKLY